MIKRELFYFAECDGCGAELLSNNCSDIHYQKKSEIIEDIEDSEWVKKGHEWFCPECQEKSVA